MSITVTRTALNDREEIAVELAGLIRVQFTALNGTRIEATVASPLFPRLAYLLAAAELW